MSNMTVTFESGPSIGRTPREWYDAGQLHAGDVLYSTTTIRRTVLLVLKDEDVLNRPRLLMLVSDTGRLGRTYCLDDFTGQYRKADGLHLTVVARD